MTSEFSLPHWLRHFLLVLSGLMLAFAFPPFPSGILAAFAFVPLFIVFEEIATLGKAFRSSYITFFVFNLFAVWWVSGMVHGKDPYLMVAGASLVLGHPLFMFIPMAAFTIVRKHLGFKVSIFAFPFLWTAFEYLHSITQFAFPWLLLGNTQTYDLASIQFASVTGVYGVSFWLLWINVIAYVLYAKLALKEWRPLSPQSVAAALVIIMVYFLPKIYGQAVLEQTDVLTEGKPLKIGIAQPNIDPFEKWEQNRDKQLAILQELLKEIAERKVDFVMWPETAIPFYVLSSQHYDVLERLRGEIDSLNVALFTGIPDVVYYSQDEKIPQSSKVIAATGQRYDTFNGSMLLQPHITEIQKYAKIILVPFAERVPYAELFSFSTALQWNVGLGGWGIGTDTTVFRLHLLDSTEVRFSNLICYESIYPGFVANFVRRGAEFLTIITNDSWWGNTFGPYQHQQFAVFRAIENRRWIARCANGGISCFVDPFGNVIQPTSMFTKTTVVGEIKAKGDLTFYSIHGDVFAQFCLSVSGLLLGTAFGKKFYYSYRRQQGIS